MTQEVPKPFVLEEVAGTDVPGIPMTTEDRIRLDTVIDPMVEQLITNLEIEKKRRELSDAYMMRTIPNIKEL